MSVVRQPDAAAAAAAEPDVGHLTKDGPRGGGSDCSRTKGRLFARVAAGAAGAALQAAKGVPFRQQRGAWCDASWSHLGGQLRSPDSLRWSHADAQAAVATAPE